MVFIAAGGAIMNWQVIWFLVNIVFVASLITTLFLHRTVSISRLQQAPVETIKRQKGIRNLLCAVTIVSFIAMSGAFLADMYYNG